MMEKVVYLKLEKEEVYNEENLMMKRSWWHRVIEIIMKRCEKSERGCVRQEFKRMNGKKKLKGHQVHHEKMAEGGGGSTKWRT